MTLQTNFVAVLNLYKYENIQLGMAIRALADAEFWDYDLFPVCADNWNWWLTFQTL